MGLENKVKSFDRIIVLSQKEGLKTQNSSGLTDPRLFTGGNRLHGVLGEDGLWSARYDYGIIEESLKQKFTSFAALLRHLKKHYLKRNVDVKEVLD